MSYEYVDSLKGLFAKKNGNVVEKQMMCKGEAINFPKRPNHTGASILYTGEIKNYRPNNYGQFLIKTGAGFPDFGYEGNWIDGNMEGEGKYFANSLGENDFPLSYEGSFKKNNFHGFGAFKTSYLPKTNPVFKQIHILYEGEWVNGKRNGIGTQTWDHHENIENNELNIPNYSTYEGSWLDDKFHGKGKLNSIFGWVFEGEFQNGMKNGYGKLINKNGEIIEGNWINNSLVGS
jgi:hypothetical protein